MSKLDYSKVEEKLAHALQSTMVKRIVRGDPTVSSEAVSYYALNDGKRPYWQDPVLEAIEEMKREAKEIELEELRQKGLLPPENVALSEKKEPSTTEAESQKEEIVTTDSEPKIFEPLFLLRKHLSWLKKQNVENIFSTLGVEESFLKNLYEKESLSIEEQQQVKELEVKAAELRDLEFEKMEIAENDALIEKERKKHINKRFKIRENWLPLDTH